eukprot:505083-Pyramimonas_sp.AAC.1
MLEYDRVSKKSRWPYCYMLATPCWWAAIKSNCNHYWKKLRMLGQDLAWSCIGINSNLCWSAARSTS